MVLLYIYYYRAILVRCILIHFHLPNTFESHIKLTILRFLIEAILTLFIDKIADIYTEKYFICMENLEQQSMKKSKWNDMYIGQHLKMFNFNYRIQHDKAEYHYWYPSVWSLYGNRVHQDRAHK